MICLGIYIGQNTKDGFVVRDTIAFKEPVDIPSIVIHQIEADGNDIRFIHENTGRIPGGREKGRV